VTNTYSSTPDIRILPNHLIGRLHRLKYEYARITNRQYNIFPLYYSETRENIIIHIAGFAFLNFMLHCSIVALC